MTGLSDGRAGAGSDLHPWGDPDRVSPFRLLAVVLRHRVRMLRLALVAALVTVVVTLVLPRTWTVSASFIPQARRAPSNLAGIAAQFGVAIPVSDPSQTPPFYVDLLKSREILGKIVDTSYTFGTPEGPVTANVMDYLWIWEQDSARRREDGIWALRKRVIPTFDLKTGVVDLQVSVRYPELALQITQHVLEELNRFNLVTRQSQAASEKTFTATRLAEVERALRAAEDALQHFLERNRDYRNSPLLTFEQDRLARRVSEQQELYSSLSQAYEQAKIEEVRDTPVFTILEEPELPARPDRRYMAVKALLALILGGAAGLGLGLLQDMGTRSRHGGDPDFVEYAELRRQALDELRHPGRAVRRLVGLSGDTGTG